MIYYSNNEEIFANGSSRPLKRFIAILTLDEERGIATVQKHGEISPEQELLNVTLLSMIDTVIVLEPSIFGLTAQQQVDLVNYFIDYTMNNRTLMLAKAIANNNSDEIDKQIKGILSFVNSK